MQQAGGDGTGLGGRQPSSRRRLVELAAWRPVLIPSKSEGSIARASSQSARPLEGPSTPSDARERSSARSWGRRLGRHWRRLVSPRSLATRSSTSLQPGSRKGKPWLSRCAQWGSVTAATAVETLVALTGGVAGSFWPRVPSTPSWAFPPMGCAISTSITMATPPVPPGALRRPCETPTNLLRSWPPSCAPSHAPTYRERGAGRRCGIPIQGGATPGC